MNKQYKPYTTTLYVCNLCGENVGYLGWLFTTLRIPFLKHKCSGADKTGEGS